MFDLTKFMADLPNAPTAQTTATGRRYTTVAIEKHGSTELKCNVDVAQGLAKINETVIPIALLIIRFAEKQATASPRFEIPERAEQVAGQANEGLYRYEPMIFPLCPWGPIAYIKTRWEAQDVGVNLSKILHKVIDGSGGVVQTGHLDATIERWVLETTSADPEFFTMATKDYLANIDKDIE